MSAFDAAFGAVIGVEGKYSNNPNDSGGPTMYGITQVTARAHGYTGDMRDLPLDTAKEIYKSQYWDLLRLDDIAASAPDVALEMFDSGVNCGVARAAKWLQRTLNVLNHRGSAYPDVEADGNVGPMTVSAFRQLVAWRGDDGVLVVLRALDGFQRVHYVELAEQRAKDEDFVFGQLLNRTGA